MTNPHDQGWGDPTTPGWEAENIITIHAGGVILRVHKELAKLFTYYVNEVAKHYPLAHVKDDSGYNCRPIRGYEAQWARTHDFDYLSIHSWGGAVDLDSTVNPMTTDPKAHHEFMGNVIHPILLHFRGRMQWGGDFEHRHDYMHTQFIGTPRDAVVLTRQMGL